MIVEDHNIVSLVISVLLDHCGVRIFGDNLIFAIVDWFFSPWPVEEIRKPVKILELFIVEDHSIVR